MGGGIVVCCTLHYLNGNSFKHNFRLTDLDNEEVRLVKQYHYTTWPDFGVPATPSDFIQYLQDIRNTGGLGPGTEEE